MNFSKLKDHERTNWEEGRDRARAKSDVWGVGWGYDGNYRKFLLITAIGGARDVKEKRGGTKGKVQFN